jgi:hypothetical protein
MSLLFNPQRIGEFPDDFDGSVGAWRPNEESSRYRLKITRPYHAYYLPSCILFFFSFLLREISHSVTALDCTQYEYIVVCFPFTRATTNDEGVDRLDKSLCVMLAGNIY